MTRNMLLYSPHRIALERHGTKASAKLAEDLLELLEEYYPHLVSDIAIYNSVLNAWSIVGKNSCPDVALYVAQRADRLICEMMKRSYDADSPFPRPNESSFLMAINAWSHAASVALASGDVRRSETAAEQAESLLEMLQSQPLQPRQITLACFGAVIRTWAMLSGRSTTSGNYASRAQSLLEKMAKDSNGMPLDLIHVNAVLDAWARELAVVSSSANSNDTVAKLSNLNEILMKMKMGGYRQSFNVEPDASSFNHVIRACYAPWASTRSRNVDDDSRKIALGLAMETYSSMNKGYNSSHRPDAHTYSHMFKAIACLLPQSSSKEDNTTLSERFDACKIIFEDCCRGGYLTKSSFWVVHKMLQGNDEFIELLLSELGRRGDISKDKLMGMSGDDLYKYLPTEWSRSGRSFGALNRHK